MTMNIHKVAIGFVARIYWPIGATLFRSLNEKTKKKGQRQTSCLLLTFPPSFSMDHVKSCFPDGTLRTFHLYPTTMEELHKHLKM